MVLIFGEISPPRHGRRGEDTEFFSENVKIAQRSLFFTFVSVV
jgi:hypothetical protein